MVAPVRLGYREASPGRVAQRESARFTRGRSLVRSQPRPLRKCLQRRHFWWSLARRKVRPTGRVEPFWKPAATSGRRPATSARAEESASSLPRSGDRRTSRCDKATARPTGAHVAQAPLEARPSPSRARPRASADLRGRSVRGRRSARRRPRARPHSAGVDRERADLVAELRHPRAIVPPPPEPGADLGFRRVARHLDQ